MKVDYSGDDKCEDCLAVVKHLRNMAVGLWRHGQSDCTVCVTSSLLVNHYTQHYVETKYVLITESLSFKFNFKMFSRLYCPIRFYKREKYLNIITATFKLELFLCNFNFRRIKRFQTISVSFFSVFNSLLLSPPPSNHSQTHSPSYKINSFKKRKYGRKCFKRMKAKK